MSSAYDISNFDVANAVKISRRSVAAKNSAALPAASHSIIGAVSEAQRSSISPWHGVLIVNGPHKRGR